MAQNIWDDAFKNTLHRPADRIERYLVADPDIINQAGGQANLTPLAGACYNGHLEVIKLLLEKGALPNAPCPLGRTALFYALQQALPNQLPIVKALLAPRNNAADPNEVYPEDDNVNPLTIAINELQDSHIVQVLVDAGAKPTQENRKQAKARKMERSLVPWKEAAGSFVDLATSAMSLILIYTEGGTINTTIKGVLRKMYTITDAVDTAEPKSSRELGSITNFVRSAGLERFFSQKSAFLQTVAERALALRNDPSTDLGKPENIKRLVHLSLYQLVIYCNDSGSMSWDSDGNDATHLSKSRYYNLCHLVGRIAKVATKLLPDDAMVKIRFVHKPFNADVPVSRIDNVMADVCYQKNVPLGAHLHERILKPLVYNTISNAGAQLEQPLLICIITDVAPNPNDTPLKDLVLQCKTALVDKKYEPTSVTSVKTR